MNDDRLFLKKQGNGGVDIVGWFQESWEIFKSGWQVYMLSSLIFIVVNLIAQIIPFAGVIIAGPMIVGLYLVIADHLAGRGYNVSRLFGGFAFFIHSFLANLIIFIFTVMGLMLLILPGLVIGSWYIFTYIFIVDRGLEFWAAMEASRKLAFQDIVGFALFFLIIGIVNFLGFLFLVVGLLVTVPLTFIATFVAYRKLEGLHTLADGAPLQKKTDEPQDRSIH